MVNDSGKHGSSQDEERTSSNAPLAGFMSVNPARMSGVPVFAGTRVPVQTLFDHLAAGDALDEFLDGFEGVSREQAVAAIDAAASAFLRGAPAP